MALQRKRRKAREKRRESLRDAARAASASSALIMSPQIDPQAAGLEATRPATRGRLRKPLDPRYSVVERARERGQPTFTPNRLRGRALPGQIGETPIDVSATVVDPGEVRSYPKSRLRVIENPYGMMTVQNPMDMQRRARLQAARAPQPHDGTQMADTVRPQPTGAQVVTSFNPAARGGLQESRRRVGNVSAGLLHGMAMDRERLQMAKERQAFNEAMAKKNYKLGKDRLKQFWEQVMAGINFKREQADRRQAEAERIRRFRLMGDALQRGSIQIGPTGLSFSMQQPQGGRRAAGRLATAGKPIKLDDADLAYYRNFARQAGFEFPGQDVEAVDAFTGALKAVLGQNYVDPDGNPISPQQAAQLAAQQVGLFNPKNPESIRRRIAALEAENRGLTAGHLRGPRSRSYWFGDEPDEMKANEEEIARLEAMQGKKNWKQRYYEWWWGSQPDKAGEGATASAPGRAVNALFPKRSGLMERTLGGPPGTVEHSVKKAEDEGIINTMDPNADVVFLKDIGRWLQPSRDQMIDMLAAPGSTGKGQMNVPAGANESPNQTAYRRRTMPRLRQAGMAILSDALQTAKAQGDEKMLETIKHVNQLLAQLGDLNRDDTAGLVEALERLQQYSTQGRE